MVKFFENTRPSTVITSLFGVLIISIIGVVKYFNNELFHNTYSIQGYYPLVGDVMGSIFSIIIVLSMAILMHNIVHQHSITKDNSFAILFFALLLSTNQNLVIFNPVLAASIFQILSLKYLLSLHEHTKMTQKLFNAGLLIGISSVIDPYFSLYGILIYIGVIIYGADNWRQWFLPLLGMALPFYFAFTYHYLFDSLDVFWTNYFIQEIDLSTNELFNSKGTILLWGIYISLTIFATLDYSSHIRSQKLDTRKGYSMNYLALVIGILIVAFGDINNGQEFIILFFPTSIIWAKYIQHKKKKRWKNLFFLIIIINTIFSYFLNSL